LTFPEPGLADDGPADWSPDGSTIIFERDYVGDLGIAQIFRINADGSGLTLLTECTGDCLGNAFPSYSPDGRRIAFIRWIGPVRPDENATSGGIWVMNADGSNPVQLTQSRLPTTTEDSHPRWSPDGRNLVFMRLNTAAEPLGRQAVFVSAVNGSGARRITPWSLDANEPDWSPDGTRILVSAHDDAIAPGIGELYTVRPDGSGLHKLLPHGLAQAPDSPRIAENGKFSPDGRGIVFQHQIAPDWCCVIYRMDADGDHVRRLTLTDDAAFAPNWGPHR
jgi:TolB protein